MNNTPMDEVIEEGHHSKAIGHEWTTSSARIKDAVHTKTTTAPTQRVPQSIQQAPTTTNTQAHKVCATGSIADPGTPGWTFVLEILFEEIF